MGKTKPIRTFDYVAKPYERVHSLLEWNASAVFRDATKSAATRATDLASALHIKLGKIELGTDVVITVKGIRREPRTDTAPESTKIHLEWKASRVPEFFPLMKAEITVSPLGPSETQLEFNGEYEPPLGALGGMIDAAVGHRIAEASVHQFVKDIIEHLNSTID